jgi:hypothetical protein
MGPFELEQTEQVTQVEHEKLFEYRMRPVGSLALQQATASA